jgi:acetoin utilization protein AcuB
MRILDYATRHVTTVSPIDSIDKAISLMEERNVHHLVATSGGRVEGMISDRDILISTGWMLSVERKYQRPGERHAHVAGPMRVLEIMSKPVACLTVDHSARDAAALMLERKISAVPILNRQALAALVTETDLVKWPPLSEKEADALLNREVRDLMRASVLSVSPEAPLAELIHLFRERRIRHVPVVVNHQLVGIVSDRDVRRALGWGSIRDMQAENQMRLMEKNPPQKAGDIMHSAVRTVGLFTSLRSALRTMLDERIHALPVVETDCLKGILTMSDFLRAFAGDGEA